MRLLKISLIAILSISVFACNTKLKSDKNIEKSESENLVAKIQNIEVEIEGMTCEIGCAKLIESKTHKLEGMTFANVSFEHGIGQFTFDTNKISVEAIEKHINGIAGGELYKVTSSKVVEKFTILESSEEVSE